MLLEQVFVLWFKEAINYRVFRIVSLSFLFCFLLQPAEVIFSSKSPFDKDVAIQFSVIIDFFDRNVGSVFLCQERSQMES